jgi:hypothetical protein
VNLSTKPELVLILPSLRIYRSLHKSELENNLKRIFQLKVLVPEKELLPTDLEEEEGEVFFYTESKRSAWLNKLALDVETFRLKSFNVSYETRIRLITNLPQPKALNFKSFWSIKSQYGVLLSILASGIGYRILGKMIQNLGSMHRGLNRLLNSCKPESIVCFSGGFYSGLENFLGKYAESKSIPYFLIIDNWDNLSSKSVLWNKPNLMGVWGPEMAADATELHDIDSDRIVQLGSSRLDLVTSINRPLEAQPYALFAGTGIQHLDEIEALIETRRSLDGLGRTDVSIIYRPHPWNLRGDFAKITSTITNIPGIIIDKDIADNGSKAFYDQASLFHLENLVKNCEFLIAGHSTVIVEALYHGKKVLALTGSNHFLFNTSDSWIIYRHMSRLRGNLGITECNNINQIGDALRLLFKTEIPHSNLVPHIIPNFQTDYSTRVIEALMQINTLKQNS